MIFQSIEYLIFLFAIVFIYWTFCKDSNTKQNSLIVLASIAFYSWWDWRFLGLLILTTLSTYYAAILQSNKPQFKQAVIWGVLILNIGILFFFKYYNFFIESLIDSLSLLEIKLNASTLNIILPVGISFYTFSALSYYIDVHQGKIEPTKNILAYMAYTMFFPSILSGPISKAQKQLPQYFNTRTFDYSNMVNASLLFLWGAMMKLCLADRLGIYVDTVYANIAQHSGTTLLFTSILYTIQIYADFAGYSLMAIGSGKLLGINLQTNFNRPYFATTVTDFWRRWHISLSTWFRDYIYIPLGGSRCSTGRWIFNTLVVFVVSGLWHGAAYTFLLWGALHGMGLVTERLIYGDRLKSITNSLSIGNIFRWGITFIFIKFISKQIFHKF